MMRMVALFTCFLSGCFQNSTGQELPIAIRKSNEKYLVVAFVDRTSEFFPAAERLAKRHQAELVVVDPAELEPVVSALKTHQPTTVAYVLEPKTLEVNLVQRLLKIATQLDEDPFVDFAYGFITGRDGAAALKLVDASERPVERAPTISMLGVGGMPGIKSSRSKSAWPLKSGTIPMVAYTCAGDSDQNRDDAFISKSMPALSETPILLLASHGYPTGLVGGPKANDLQGTSLPGSVLLNIACYNGVTNTWYEEDYQSMTLRRREVPASESFCLQAIDSGVAAYFAYVTPRPAGPLMMGDALLVASQGTSMGELQQANLNAVVLAHLFAGESAVSTVEMRDGAAIPPTRLPADVVKVFSTGGVLIGDPAFRPFPAKPNTDPRSTTVQDTPDGWRVEVTIGSAVPHFYASEQINYWNGTDSAMRVETRIPIANRTVRDINATELPAGVKQAKLVGAIEEDQGERFLRLKLVFAQPQDMKLLQSLVQKGVHAQFEVLADDNVDPQTAPTVFRKDITQ